MVIKLLSIGCELAEGIARRFHVCIVRLLRGIKHPQVPVVPIYTNDGTPATVSLRHALVSRRTFARALVQIVLQLRCHSKVQPAIIQSVTVNMVSVLTRLERTINSSFKYQFVQAMGSESSANILVSGGVMRSAVGVGKPFDAHKINICRVDDGEVPFVQRNPISISAGIMGGFARGGYARAITEFGITTDYLFAASLAVLRGMIVHSRRTSSTFTHALGCFNSAGAFRSLNYTTKGVACGC